VPQPPPAAAPQPVAPKPPVAAPPQRAAPKAAAEPKEKAEVKLANTPVKQPEPKAQQPEPTAVVARATVAAPAKAARSVATMVPTPAAKVASETRAREQQIAAAVQRRAQEQQIAAAVQRRAHDQQIADAVQRRAEAAGERTAARGETGGGPVSLGEGTGTGGVVEGLDLILYRGQMERRIKENWVWAGDDPALEVKIQFDITATGHIQNVRVTGSSGNPSYDASAERAVRAASPMAPPPEKYRELFVHGVEITFRAQDLRS
jgi:colicin import membrane protein